MQRLGTHLYAGARYTPIHRGYVHTYMQGLGTHLYTGARYTPIHRG